jgi:ubiquinone/menaquinone biosynthesis C-methylase UbiE
VRAADVPHDAPSHRRGRAEGPDLSLLRCPACRSPLTPAATCSGCGRAWPRRDGLLHLYDEAQVVGTDRLLRRIYDGAPALHDPAVRWTFPLFGTGTEDEMRRAYHTKMGWEALRPRADGTPVRILDAGIGTGSDLPWIVRALPPGLPVEIWGFDLSIGMLRRCVRRVARDGPPTRLLLADVHALPFPDDTFDRVLHVGALNSFRDPAGALAELARVARPGTPIGVVDERLDPAGAHTLAHRAAFRAICFYRMRPPPPESLLPPGAAAVDLTQIGRFFFAMTFEKVSRTPSAAPRGP